MLTDTQSASVRSSVERNAHDRDHYPLRRRLPHHRLLRHRSRAGYAPYGYYGIVFGEVITGINFLRDFGAGIRNIVGGRSEGYEQELLQTRNEALQELEQRAASMGAHAVVGVDMDYEVLGQGNMLMVTASGTAVTLEQA